MNDRDPDFERDGDALKLPDNALDAVRMGAIFDFRVRLASDMLVHGGLAQALAVESPREIAEHALDIAGELVALAVERKLVWPLEDEACATRLREHGKRNAEFQVRMQMDGQRCAQDAQSLAGSVAGAFAPGSRRAN